VIVIALLQLNQTASWILRRENMAGCGFGGNLSQHGMIKMMRERDNVA
jgi:hypothetical protein